jgi:hypothetical protein
MLPDHSLEFKGSCFIYQTFNGKYRLTVQNQFGLENFIDEISLSQDPKIALCVGLHQKGYFVELSTLRYKNVRLWIENEEFKN